MALSRERPFKFNSPLGDLLLFHEMRGTEQLGRVSGYTVHLLSPAPDIDLADLIGETVSVSVDLTPYCLDKRYFHGHVVRFQREGKHGSYFVYSAHIAPWLWLLSYSANCRIFQDMTVPDIIKDVFRQHGMFDFEEALTCNYPQRDYVAQYDETDLEFVSRLMEDVGIYYFFKHTETKHILVLADSCSAHTKPSGYEAVLMSAAGRNAREDRIDRWGRWLELQSGGVALSDYDFTKPRVPLLAKRVAADPHPRADFEVYRYPGNHKQTAEGEKICQRHLEELHARYEQMGGAGNVRGLGSGHLFELVNEALDGERHEYLVDFASYELSGGVYETSDGSESESSFRVQLSVLASQRPFRPERRFKPKKVAGPQTATVVGKEGEEIWTDEYGRVKVKFHWDRTDPRDETSSCWLRVAQPWAGRQWGAIHIPRIGSEVIVDFLDGDPDRPIITGSLYNADNMPPYKLPDNQTRTGIKTRSIKDGTADNFNEISFEDKKGEEELHVQAERDHTVNVKRNESISVGGDRSLTVVGNHSVAIEGKGQSPVHSTVNVTGKHTLDASDTIKLQAPTSITLECGGSAIVLEPGKITLTAGGGAKIVLDADTLTMASGGGLTKHTADVLHQSSAGSRITLDANVEATAVAGAKLKLDANVLAQSTPGSKVHLDAAALMQGTSSAAVTGASEATLTAGGTVKASPAGVEASGTKVDVTGAGLVNIAGSIVKIN